ncbi:hypothetical protein M422DRAFT_242166 [Sphaerobolus stellatus SS14]|nr:hypothetical protein M422DRAFT_242166 [Sphaerobolus stellatus SS14]
MRDSSFAAHPLVKEVIYAGLFVNVWVFVDKAKEGNKRRGKGDFPFGGMVSFRFGGAGELADDGAVERFLTRTRLFTLAESLGGVGSLAELPEKMTNGSIPPAERLARGITPNFIRLTVGVEDVDDWNKHYRGPSMDGTAPAPAWPPLIQSEVRATSLR